MVFSPWADGGPTPNARNTRKRAAARRAAKTVTKATPKIWNSFRAAAPKPAPAPRRRTTPVAPRPANTYAPARTSTGRVVSNAGAVGGGVGGGRVTPPAPPAPPSVDEWLAGDTAYLSTTDALQKALADYQARMNQQKGQYQTEFDTNLGNLNTSREAAIADLTDDFAARGLMNSGLFANSRAELMSDYDARQAALEQGRSNFLADLEAAFADFQSEQELTKTKARQDALARRAQRYGLG